MITLDTLSDDSLQELSQRTEELGVLSVYADTRPGGRPGPEGLAIDLKNRYRELLQRMRPGDPQVRDRRTVPALENLAPLVESLSGPGESGRSRILFAGLSGDWSVQLASAMAVPNRLVLGEGPFIHPLLELLDEGRPAGVLAVSPDEVRLHEWRLGRLRPLGVIEQVVMEAPHERAGQIGGGPAGQFHTPVREHRQARHRELAERFLGRVVDAVPAMVGERGWERIVLAGEARWIDQLADGLPGDLQEGLIRETRVLAGIDEPTLEGLMSDLLHEEHAAWEQRLVEQILAAAHAGRGALGLSEVTAALNGGRVAHLVYDPEVRYTGSVDDDGVLYAGDETRNDRPPAAPETRLTERMVSRALATGSRITPVEGAATGTLREAAGVAALLRW